MHQQLFPGADSADKEAALPGAVDAVEQARLWLAERGVAVPDADVEWSASPSRMATRSEEAVSGGTGELHRDGQAEPQTPTPPPVGPAGDPEADPEAVARTIVLRKLAAQARTRAELSKALQRKEVPPEAAKAVLDRMEAVGLVDDGQLAQDWVESRQQRRYLSRTALRRELTAKGVDRVQIDAALEQVDSDAELEAARALAAKKSRSLAGLEEAVRYRRLAGMLGRRGFSPGIIAQVAGESVRPPHD